ncbi:hypothetical protein LWI28_002167 [Acer negundo]|uniref:non-specific serine/threonine protein kinase n=1 Tax=Acer negundo TaxID=4023 RepID=A0AAD5I883_ACENE|nr:hypothetical protein LWI28_002167 [Acer negundo]
MDKIHHKYLLPNHIPTILFTSIYIIIFFQHLSVPVAGDSPHIYDPTETIFLNCGSFDNITSQDGTRTWITDIKSEHFLLQQSESIALIPAKPSDDTPYTSARLSSSQFSYIFNLTPGQKFIRLHFYETSYQIFDRSKAFFSVKAGSFTLLSNYSTALAANFSGQEIILKEFCVNVQENQNLNITFTPSQDYNDSYAFINGIEIVSMPLNLYYTTATGATEYPIVGNSNALEMVYRVNVGGRSISPGDDTGMYRAWSYDDSYLTEAYPSAIPVNLSLQPIFSLIPNYSAPVEVYQTARTMGNDSKVNENHLLTWEFPVDSAFPYLVRLHFCEFQPEITVTGDRIFQIYIDNQMAEERADVIRWGGGNGVPVYIDYAVTMGSKANQKKQNLSIALHPAPAYMTKYSDAILNGVEIFKVDSSGSLAGPNPDSQIAQPTSGQEDNNQRVLVIILTTTAAVILLLGILLCYCCIRFRMLKSSKGKVNSAKDSKNKINSTAAAAAGDFNSNAPNLIVYNLNDIEVATDNLSIENKLGEGGYGPVYKGVLPDGQEIAVKKLSKTSTQGFEEFKNEVMLTAKLQHINLVRVLGFCIDREEQMLVYEYMPNKSLDHYLFDPIRLYILDWKKRVDIIEDFGMARIFRKDDHEANTERIVGTYGYIPPEYAIRGIYSTKSDVYSFGVLLLQIISGKKVSVLYGENDTISLLDYAYKLWKDHKGMDFMDPLRTQVSDLQKQLGVLMEQLHTESFRIKRPIEIL